MSAPWVRNHLQHLRFCGDAIKSLHRFTSCHRRWRGCIVFSVRLNGSRNLQFSHPIILISLTEVVSCVALSWLRLLFAMVPTRGNSSVLGLGPELNRSNGFYHPKTQTIAIGLVFPPKTRHFNLTTLAPIEYLSSDHIMIWSIHRLCSFRSFFTSRFQICNPTNIRGVAIENPRISLKSCPYFTATQRISVRSQIWMLEVEEIITLYKLRIHHVLIRSELKSLIAASAVESIKLEQRSSSDPANNP